MRPKETVAAVIAAVVLLAMVTTFAIEISNTQAKNQQDVRARVHDRAVLAGALVDGLFNTVTGNGQQYDHLYGGATVSSTALDRQRQTDAYLVVLDAHGHVLGTSQGISRPAAQSLAQDLSVRLVDEGDPYGLGNLVTEGGHGVLNFAVPFTTSYGRRILVSGFGPGLLDALLGTDLGKIPRVQGALNYVIDGNGAVLASTSPRIPISSHFAGPFPRGNVRDFSRDNGRHYLDEVQLAGSRWRIVLDSPDGPLYASISGLTKWLPWVLFAAFAFVGVLVFVLVGRVFAAAAEARAANARLGLVNAELEETNQMLSERAAELARSNEELEQFASIASHDLQEPLRKVRTFTEQLSRLESDNLSEKGQDYLRRANMAAARMQTLIEDLLRFSRVSTHARPAVEVDLGEVVHDVLDDLSQVVEQSGARLHVGQLPTLPADPAQMRQLFQNLISNALKFAVPDQPPEVWVEGQADERDVHVTVRDNGIGFAPRYAERIFRVFERLHGRGEYPGTGIGLALCRKIVDRHGGSITADSLPGHGASFIVTLPRHRAETTDPSPHTNLAGESPALKEAHV